MGDEAEQSFATFFPKSGADFVETPYIQDITSRALDFVTIGMPVHFRGTAGVGKTTLAMHVAARIGRPVIIIYGDFALSTPDFVGSFQGYRTKKIVDNYIRTVMREEENASLSWTHGALLEACKNGYALIYDEFTRSRAETNNIFLSVLEEHVLPLPLWAGYGGYLKIHPDFVAIFTSNPRDYAGTQRSADALLDRMATIELGNFDEETEVAICRSKSGADAETASRIVTLVRKVRNVKADKYLPSIRSSILIGKLARLRFASAACGDPVFLRICIDTLVPDAPDREREAIEKTIRETIQEFGDGGRSDAGKA